MQADMAVGWKVSHPRRVDSVVAGSAWLSDVCHRWTFASAPSSPLGGPSSQAQSSERKQREEDRGGMGAFGYLSLSAVAVH